MWHLDLMYLYIRPRWYYLVDILDGYSRYLGHWKVNLTMQADLVMLAVQEALETLPRRTHREEGLTEALSTCAQGIAALTRWHEDYNHHRPHSALRSLRPIDYYRGDPEARLAERREKLQHALTARQDYWRVQGDQADAAGG